MGTELKKVITIDVSKSDKSVKDLRKRISELRDTLLNLDKTSDEYKNSVDEIVTIQNELSSVMNAGKQQIEAAEGSYNQLVMTMAELKKEWKATNDEVRRAELGSQINNINNQLKDLDSTIGNSQRNVGNYNEGVKEGLNLFAQQKDLIKQLKNELLGLEEGTEEYNVKLSQLADAQFKLKDMNELAARSANDLGEKIATCTRLAGGLASGFGAIQGTLALFGAESENVEKTMVRLQGVIAMVQGVQGLEGLTKDLTAAKLQFADNIKGVKGFITGLSGVQKAIFATGIGVFVVALGMVVAHWKDIVKWMGFANTKMEETKKLIEADKKGYENFNDELQHTINLKKADGETTKDVLQYEKQQLQERLAGYDRQRREYETLKSIKGKLDKADEERLKSINELYDETSKQVKEIDREIEIEDKRLGKEQRDEAKKIAEERKKALEEVRKTELDTIKEREEEIRKGNLTEEQLLTEKYNQELALYKKYGKDTTALTNQYVKDVEKIQTEAANKEYDRLQKNADEKYTLLEKKIEDIRTLADEKIGDIEFNASFEDINNPEQAAQKQIELNNAVYEAIYQGYLQEKALLEQSLLDETLSANQKVEIKKRLAANEDKINKEQLRKEKANAKETENLEKAKQAAKRQTVSMIGNLMGTMSQLLGEDTAAGKAAAIANTTISTWQTAQEAYAAAFNPGGVHSPALGALMMAQAIGTGLINLKNIMGVSTDIKGGGASSIGSITSGASAVPSNASISDNLKMDNVRNILGDEEIENLNNAIKVYVLESDITDTQKKANVTENNATF